LIAPASCSYRSIVSLYVHDGSPFISRPANLSDQLVSVRAFSQLLLVSDAYSSITVSNVCPFCSFTRRICPYLGNYSLMLKLCFLIPNTVSLRVPLRVVAKVSGLHLGLFYWSNHLASICWGTCMRPRRPSTGVRGDFDTGGAHPVPVTLCGASLVYTFG
jgi:hypothetical protein